MRSRDQAKYRLERFRMGAFVLLFPLIGAACNQSPTGALFDPGFALLGPARFSVYWSDPGVSPETAVDKKIDMQLVKLIDAAEKSVDLAVYNLDRQVIIDAMINARERGVLTRMVGDVDESPTSGYQQVLRYGRVPFSLGNSDAIQHNKFAVVDGKYVFMGTGNYSNSDLDRNNNNFMAIESDTLAADYKTEFEQMFYGRYGARKLPFTSNHSHRVNLTPVEVYFSPYAGEEAVRRMISLVDGAQREVQFIIFAFTHDELTSALIRAAKRGVMVRGVHDYTFVKGTSEEAPRLFSAGRYSPFGPFNREDGNENTAVPGVRSHGGKLHAKTLIIDGSVVCTGSFNWSNNAVNNNDENMMVVYSPFVAAELQKQWDGVWAVSKPVTDQIDHPSGDTANPGDLVISEVMWAGSYTGATFDANDDWIELYNTTNHTIDVSHWILTWEETEFTHYPMPDEFTWYEPGVNTRHLSLGRLTIPSHSYFLLKGATGAISTYDNKISGSKNFSLSSASMHLRLYDLTMTLIDEAGDGGPPFAGKLDSFGARTFSMERIFSGGVALPGTRPGSWYTSNGNNCNGAVTGSCPSGSTLQGTGQIQETYRTGTIGTPNYSGNGSSTIASPSTATGGANNYGNIPVEAYATGSTTAVVKFRWSLLSAPTFGADIASTGCANNVGAITAALDPSDSSKVILTTPAQTAGLRYCVRPTSSPADVVGGTVLANSSIAFDGYGNAQAQLQIYRVYPSQSSGKDVVILQALTSGRVYGLGLYLYDFSSQYPILLYKFQDFNISAGHYIMVTMNNSCDVPCTVASATPEDRRIITANPTPNNVVSLNESSNPTSGGCMGLACNNTWELFSSFGGLATSDGIIFVGASADITAAVPQDVMCYSNRDGDVSPGLMTGGFRDLLKIPQAY
ncbi:MAG: lamin tail domain-containing protein, partial [Spirochaetia bacterium]|nr:lamin tail domain-containing protein [Spirochaetia bacterium]